jgi:hypothetical protein
MRLGSFLRGVFDLEASLLTIFAAPMVLFPFFSFNLAIGQATSLIVIVYSLVLVSLKAERLSNSVRRLDDRLADLDRDLGQLADRVRWVEGPRGE